MILVNLEVEALVNLLLFSWFQQQLVKIQTEQLKQSQQQERPTSRGSTRSQRESKICVIQ